MSKLLIQLKNNLFLDEYLEIFDWLLSGNVFARDFIRHIRNSFAHGNMKLQNRKGTYFLEIKDFSTDKAQNAYIVLPLESLKAVFKIFKNIEKGI